MTRSGKRQHRAARAGSNAKRISEKHTSRISQRAQTAGTAHAEGGVTCSVAWGGGQWGGAVAVKRLEDGRYELSKGLCEAGFSAFWGAAVSLRCFPLDRVIHVT